MARTLFVLLAGFAATPGHAQEISPLASPVLLPSAKPLGPEAAPPPPRGGEPAIEKRVNEDNHVRIEELRVRGESQSIVVHPKVPGMPAYEIVVPQPGVDPAQDKQAGQRVWFSLKF